MVTQSDKAKVLAALSGKGGNHNPDLSSYRGLGAGKNQWIDSSEKLWHISEMSKAHKDSCINHLKKIKTNGETTSMSHGISVDGMDNDEKIKILEEIIDDKIREFQM